MLKSEDESVIKRAQLLSAENTGVNAYPVIEVSFLNNKGIESYWSYSSYSVNDAGAVHINDYTGNLVYELPIASSISEIMPVSIVGYYNNYCANELICEINNITSNGNYSVNIDYTSKKTGRRVKLCQGFKW